MPIGNNLARCHECGRQWIVGDCIPSICPQCECKNRGHQVIAGHPFCGRCGDRLPPRGETVEIDFANKTVKTESVELVRVEIDLTMNMDGEWVAYGDNSPSQNSWRNSMKYRIVADVPKPIAPQVSAECHPIDHIKVLRQIADMEVPASDCDPIRIQRAVYAARTAAREALGIDDV